MHEIMTIPFLRYSVAFSFTLKFKCLLPPSNIVHATVILQRACVTHHFAHVRCMRTNIASECVVLLLIKNIKEKITCAFIQLR